MLLNRRTSSLTLTVNPPVTGVLILNSPHPRNKLLHAGPDINFPSPRVPPELLDRIVELALEPLRTSIECFAAILPFTLASWDFHKIALRRFFNEITVKTVTHWAGISALLAAQPRGYAWFKSLSGPSAILSYKTEQLVPLTYLRSLDIQFAQEGLSTQRSRLAPLLQNITASNLTSLTLSSLPRIDVPLLRIIVLSFPRLANLHLSCTERLDFHCCWVCFEDSLGCTIHSPIPDSYADPKHLGEAFASALKPLTRLAHLHLGIFLSHEQLMYAHIDHSLENERRLSRGSAELGCQLCDVVAAEVRRHELEVSLVLAQRLKAVKSIGWSSFFVACSCKNEKENQDQDEAEDGDGFIQQPESDVKGEGAVRSAALETTIWVLRAEGRIRVRRRPW